MIDEIIEHYRTTGRLSPKDFKILTAEALKMMRSMPVGRNIIKQQGTDKQLKDFSEHAVSDLVQAVASGARPESVGAYLYIIAKNKLQNKSVTLLNKHRSTFNAWVRQTLQSLEKEGSIYSKHYRYAIDPAVTEYGEENIDRVLFGSAYAVELQHLSGDGNFTVEAEKELRLLLKTMLSDTKMWVDRNRLSDAVCALLGVEQYAEVSAITAGPESDDPGEAGVFEVTPDTKSLSPETQQEVRDLVQIFCRKLENEYRDMKKHKEYYWPLWYYRISERKTLKEIAEKLNVKSHTNIDYMLNKKFRLEERIKAFVLSVTMDGNPGVDDVAVGQYTLDVFSEEIKLLFDKYNGGGDE